MTLLRSASLADGSRADVRIDDDLIGAVGPAGSLEPAPGEEVHDLAGYLLLPAPAEPHAHLDKALTADRVPNPEGDLPGAIEAWIEHRRSIDVPDALERGRSAALAALAHGATAIRSHVDVGEGIGLRSLEALLALREELAGLVELQIVALVSRPVTGPEGAENRAMLPAALELGADMVGGAPHVDPDPPAALRFCMETAAEFGRPVDLHMDETLDQAMLVLPELARWVLDHGFPHPVTASHCVSLGIQPAATQADVAGRLAAARISVVAMPQTNLYLQGRGWDTSPPRGITALVPLMAAGVVVAAGGDNVQDPFNPMGRGDPLETAGLLVSAAHLAPDHAYRLVSGGARAVMGLAPVEVAPGFPADLLAVAASSVREAIATATPDRFVFSGGRLAARTRVERQVPGPVGVAGPREALTWR
ncbi:MAG: amidohydrolase family protein [Actinomycetota bacterium]